jgi:hypothetical protein
MITSMLLLQARFLLYLTSLTANVLVRVFFFPPHSTAKKKKKKQKRIDPYVCTSVLFLLRVVI